MRSKASPTTSQNCGSAARASRQGVQRAIDDLGLTAQCRVAEIGSGLGGPACLLASTPSPRAYGEGLERAGFSAIALAEVTADWVALTHDRLLAYGAERAHLLALHDPEIVAELEEVHDAVDRLFQSGKLGGLRTTAHKA